MKLNFLPLLLFMISVHSVATDENQLNIENEIIRELDQIHTMGNEWPSRLEEARTRAKEIDPTIGTKEDQNSGTY